MTKKTKLVKAAIKNPEVYAQAEIQFFRIWLEHRKMKKAAKKAAALQ
jgi:hypothetical protein